MFSCIFLDILEIILIFLHYRTFFKGEPYEVSKFLFSN